MAIVAFLALLFISEAISAAPSPNSFGIKCPVLFDGRIARSVKPADFDTDSSIFNKAIVHGSNQTFAQIIKFPRVPPSLWDSPKNTKSVEVTINDKSIYTPVQPRYLRAELFPAKPLAAGKGNTTFHWSVRNDPARPLNFSHLYQAAEGGNPFQFTFLTGTPFSKSALDPKTLSIAGARFSPTYFHTPFHFSMWHNFAVTLGWTTNTITVYYSTEHSPLRKVAGPVFNNNSGEAGFSIGIFKYPTGPMGIDIANKGYQELHVNEGLIYGGIFIEDSAGGCVSTSPTKPEWKPPQNPPVLGNPSTDSDKSANCLEISNPGNLNKGVAGQFSPNNQNFGTTGQKSTTKSNVNIGTSGQVGFSNVNDFGGISGQSSHAGSNYNCGFSGQVSD